MRAIVVLGVLAAAGWGCSRPPRAGCVSAPGHARRRGAGRHRGARSHDRRHPDIPLPDAGVSEPHRRDRRRADRGSTRSSRSTRRRLPTPMRSTPNAESGKVRGPLHGIPVLLKDNIDVVGMANSAGSLALARPSARHRRLSRRPVACRRRRDRRQDEPERVGQLQVVAIDLRLELSRRTDEEPVRARSESMRVQFGHRHGHRGKPGGDRRRHRNRRQHHLPGLGGRAGRAQANRGAGEPPGHHPDRGLAGHRRSDGAHRWLMSRCCWRRSPPSTKAIPPRRRRATASPPTIWARSTRRR